MRCFFTRSFSHLLHCRAVFRTQFAMGLFLKQRVYIVLFFVVSVIVFYFCSYYVKHFGKGCSCGLVNLKYDPEPLTIRGNYGRLGNQMFLFATLYGLGRLNKREIVLMPKNYKALTPYFQLNFPQVDVKSFRMRDPWLIGYWLAEDDSLIPPSSNFISGNIYPTSFTFFDHVREDIRKIFQFKEPFRKYAENIFRQVKRIKPWTQVFVCIHVRRGDYLWKSEGGWLRAANGREVDISYFQKSLQYFHSKYRNITFLAVSDDHNWTKTNLSPLGILALPESETPGHDLAFLSACNHTIMTYGTFGFWGGYLSGGEVLYFDDFVKPGSGMSKIFVYEKMYPKEWTGISTTPEGFWDKYTNPFMML